MKTPRTIAREYMDCFFGERPLMEMASLLNDDLEFEGPLFNGNRASDYLDALYKDPPREATYTLLHEYTDNTSSCLVYTLTKPGTQTTIAETFEASKGKLFRIRTLFNPANLR